MEWREPQPRQPPDALLEVAGDPLVALALMRRGLEEAEQARAFLDPDRYRPSDPCDFPDMAVAVRRLEQALMRGERIGIWGDFDVDGQTSTALLVEGLRRLGSEPLYRIPVRRTESHGVKKAALEAFLQRGVDLLLTCDTGIAAHEALAWAASRGVEVIVTDHHELPAQLPPALALINPHRLPDDHPAATLAGVGVAYKLMQALYAHLGRAGEESALLDLVALGLVADVASLRGDTRYLVQRGLVRLRENRRAGLRALLRATGVRAETLTEEQIGFLIGPHLNAVGRLGDANPMVEFLTTEDDGKALRWARRLVQLNFERKQLMQEVLAAARAQLERHPDWLGEEGIVLVGERWHPGIIGIVAGRLAEKLHKPVVLITTVDGVGRGSARSVEGYDVTAAIASQAHHLLGYGGHRLAAGLSLEVEAIPAFRQGFLRALRRQREAAGGPPTPTIEVEAYLPWAALTLELVDRLERLAPFGNGNPPPVLATRGLEVVDYARMGRTGEHLQLWVESPDGLRQRVIWWHWDEAALPDGPFDLAYTVRANTFRGERRLQIEWVDARPAREEAIPSVTPALPLVLDLRGVEHPEGQIEALRLSGGDLILWNEGGGGPGGVRRQALRPASTLVVWTAPPSGRLWQAAMARVKPKQVVLVGRRPPWEKAGAFLRRLAGLAKYALAHYDGKVALEAMAAATAQTEAAVAAGLRRLEARGFFTLEETEDGFLLHRGGMPDATAAQWWYNRLHHLLEESSAYRNHFLRADAQPLLLSALRRGGR